MSRMERVRIIRRLQYGTITVAGASSSTGTATITAVNTEKSVVVMLGLSHAAATNVDIRGNAWGGAARLELTNATTVTATIGGSGETDQGNTVCSFVVVEFL